MPDIEDLEPGEFIVWAGMPGMLSDDEIARWILAKPLNDQTRTALLQAIIKAKGTNDVGDTIRSAMRISMGLPPLPGT